MDSKPRRLLPFGGSSSSSLSTPSSLSASSSLGAGSLYGRGSVLSSERFGRTSSSKLDSDYQSSRYLSGSRDYGSSESRHSSWKLSSPLSSSSSVSRDRSWVEPSLGSSRSKLMDTERRLGPYTGLLSSTQDSESKRAKLSYTNRAAYARTLSGSATSSSYSSLNSASDMPWKSLSPLSRSSSSSSTSSSSSSSSEGLWARRELDKRGESGYSSLGERSSTFSSSLYRPERVTSTYAQGARPKESFGSSSRRETPSSRYLSSPASSSSSSSSDYLSPSPARTSLSSDHLTSSTSRARSTLSDPSRLSSWSSIPYTPLSQRQSSTTTPSSSTSEPTTSTTSTSTSTSTSSSSSSSSSSSQPDGRRSTRHLLSRLFSRRSSQDSSSSSSAAAPTSPPPAPAPPPPAPRLPIPSPSQPPLAAPERQEEVADPVQSAFAMLRRRRQELSPVRESRGRPSVDAQQQQQQTMSPEFWRSRAAAAAAVASGGGAAAASAAGGGGGGVGSSWLSSSLRNRCTPLFARRRREGRDETAVRAHVPPHASPDAPRTPLEEEEEDDDEEEEEEAEGAAAAAPSMGALGLSAAQLQDAARLAGLGRGHAFTRVMSNPLLRVPDHMMLAVEVGGAGGRGQPDGQEKEKPAPSRDPERLRKLQESLLLEDSDEEEGDLCRICQMAEESGSNPLIEPCRCTGSLQYVHQDCIKKWLLSKISSGSNLDAITTCELCKEKLHLNIDNFDINELYRSHERSEYEFISCGLYLVVLLHLCEQRFSDVLGAANEAGFFNLARTLHEHMDNLESSYAESDEEERDHRPSIDFCDLEDDDDEEEEEEY
ncbi:E3 ubiquitin-protein ligase MARCH7 isoform X1 [Alosa sapidissima]|uniref:E3 ubiquitin-protein ligase MARCH7 isoform X1 n=1 Tax=Alosa sapidissima TaxID=34773 RepID=UPI001C088BBE|nr:E3 ubiquitin-protein ligase MARCH7 isoform X1 [Alosa sapidissima]